MKASRGWTRRRLVLLAMLVACSPVAAPVLQVAQDTPIPSYPSTPTSMVILSPDRAVPAAPTVTPTATLQPRRSVILLSVDGGRADLVARWIDTGALPSFATVAGVGVQAEWVESVNPSLTAPAHASLATGALPVSTGIVSNSFHNSTDSFYWYREGLDAPLEGGEPLWVAASRSGLKSATIFFPGSSPANTAQMADLSIGYGARLAYSKQHAIPLALATQPWEGAPTTYSPPLEGIFRIQEVACVRLLVLDGEDDGVANYDRVLLAADPSCRVQPVFRAGENTYLEIELNEWGRLTLLPHLTAGALFLVQEITPQAVTLFHTGVYRNQAAPRDLQVALDQKFGFFTHGSDPYAVEHGWITAEDQVVLIGLATRWMGEVTAWVYQTYHPDLLLAWQDALDAAGHAFFLVDERQAGYSPERAEQYANYYLQAAQAADRSLGQLLEVVDLDSTTVLLTGDHGMAPIHTRVYVNTVLERAGLLMLDQRNYVVVERSKAFAVASGGSVNIYLNRSGQEEQGFLDEAEDSEVQAQVIALLEGLSDPETGEPIFQRVLGRAELASLGLDHTNSGAVFAQAAPGYVLDGWRGADTVFSPSTYYGQHGYRSENLEMRGLFLAAGGGIPAGDSLPPVRLIDLAPTIGAILGFPLRGQVDGEVIQPLVPNR